MLTESCIAFYGSRPSMARALGIEPPSVYSWGSYPPPLRQLQIEKLTGGALKAEPECEKYRVTA